MDCPGCSEPMVTYELDAVEVDRCLACGGTWLDHGELVRICDLHGLDGEAAAAGVEGGAMGAKSTRRCPRCQHHLRLVRTGHDIPIELDRCPHGHGVWLDKGELAAALVSFQRNRKRPERVEEDEEDPEAIVLGHLADVLHEDIPPREGEE